MSARFKPIDPTPFFERVGVALPLMNAPDPFYGTPDVAAAVSNLGGLGVLVARGLTPTELAQAIDDFKSRSEKPFAVALDIPRESFTLDGDNLVAVTEALEDFARAAGTSMAAIQAALPPDTHHFDALFDVAIESGAVALISLAGGFREPEADRLEEKGLLNVGVATSLLEGKVLRAAGVDAVIAQSADAGGVRLNFESPNTLMLGTMSLTESIARATGLPTYAWGGVATPESAQALTLVGAEGVVLEGVLVTQESPSLTPSTRETLALTSEKARLFTRAWFTCVGASMKTGVLDVLPLDSLPECDTVWQWMTRLTKVAHKSGVTAMIHFPLGSEGFPATGKALSECMKAIGEKLLRSPSNR